MRWPKGKVVKEWYGSVDVIRSKTFSARLADPGVAYAFEQAVIPRSMLAATEKPFLRPGAFFTLRVMTDPDRICIRFSRRRWTQRELDRAHRKAKRTAAAIQWAA